MLSELKCQIFDFLRFNDPIEPRFVVIAQDIWISAKMNFEVEWEGLG